MPSVSVQPLLEALLFARGPGGQEDEVRAICLRALGECCDEVSTDAAGNVITRCSTQALNAAGIRPGTRVVLSQHWRRPFIVKDSIAAHFLDDRAPLAAVITAARQIQRRKAELRQDVWFVCTTLEEESNGCIAIPTENTHGFEMVLNEGIVACAATLTEYLLDASAPRTT